MSSSDDDAPLIRSNGHRIVSTPKISKADDRALDRAVDSSKATNVGLSIRNGPVTDGNMDADSHETAGKRRSRSSMSKVNYRDDSSDDDQPLAKRPKTSAAKKAADYDSDDEPMAKRSSAGKLPPAYNETKLPESSDDDDEPLGAKLAKRKAEIEKSAVREDKKIRAREARRSIKEGDDSDDDVPLSRSSKPARRSRPAKDESSDDEPLSKSSGNRRQPANGAAKRKSAAKDESSDSDAPISKSKKRSAVSTPSSTKTAKKPAAAAKAKATKKESEEPEDGEDEDEDEDEFAWWNQPKKEDDSIKWTTLEHNGVLFPPAYQRLPPHVKLVYDGQPVDLSEEAEEVAWFFGSMLHSKHNVENPTFQKNFFADFKEIVTRTGGAKDSSGKKVPLKSFDKLDFTTIHEHAMTTNAARKARPNAEKKAETEAKKVIEAPFKFCTWDGRKEQVGNFRVEPPGLFRGRGEHPKTGMVKHRVMPEQIIINIGKGAKVPAPPAGHKWKAVQHDNKATWLAMWQENVNNQYKYVMLAANSAVKGQSDYKKFEKARELKKHIVRIRRDYTRELKSEIMADRQRATAMFLIDKLALRAGNEKDTEKEAETVGCCSLKYEHITLKPPNIVVFDFLGKDSIRFHDEVAVDAQVFKNLKLFKRAPKRDGDDVFDRLTTTQLNKHLSSYMTGLTAKVFRTYNASFTMSEELKKLSDDGRSIAEKVALYNDCNRKVAILCNHKRTIGESHATSMKKLEDKIKGIKYQRWRQKQMILDLESKQKKKKGADWFALDDDLDEAWILEHQVALVEQQKTAIQKKFEKENEKLVAEGRKPQPEKELRERLKVADQLAAKYKKENKSKKVEAEGRSPSVDKIELAIEKMDKKIHEAELEMQSREDNKEVALGTSKINYIDPRLTVVFAKKFGVPIEKFFSKTLRDKFNWAIKSVENENWEF
jgi:DNA topoisomerase-1